MKLGWKLQEKTRKSPVGLASFNTAKKCVELLEGILAKEAENGKISCTLRANSIVCSHQDETESQVKKMLFDDDFNNNVISEVVRWFVGNFLKQEGVSMTVTRDERHFPIAHFSWMDWI